jgi:tRNA threonylcarbamoyladenosine biosynthesis protein TsaE
VIELHTATHSAAETRAVGRTLGRVLRRGDVVLLAGGLGTGKTELAKGIADALGVTDAVVSPTFTLARRYEGTLELVHVDVYRLDRVQELLDLGLEEDLDDVVTVIEWGDVAAAHLPGERLEVRLDRIAGADARGITLRAEGSSWCSRLDEIERALGEPA